MKKSPFCRPISCLVSDGKIPLNGFNGEKWGTWKEYYFSKKYQKMVFRESY